jgi:hypothetical protein
MLDVPRLEPLAKQNLEDYVEAGGGVAIFLGPNSQLDFYSRWSKPTGDDASEPGFFPVPTERLEILQPSPDGTPDLVVTDHPIYRVLLREGKAFAGAIRYAQYARAPLTWKPSKDSPVQIVATLRNGSPLTVERSFGDGRVIANLSTLAPVWNTWATQPTFPVMMLETQSYLDSERSTSPSAMVGSPVQLQLESAKYQTEVSFLVPGKADRPINITRQAARPQSQNPSPLMQVGLGDEDESSAFTNRAGIYEAWPRTLDGEFDVRRYALNVDAREGNLDLSQPADLKQSLASTRADILSADELTLSASDEGGFSWSQFLMYALVALLIGEQLLAYSSGYHPPRTES